MALHLLLLVHVLQLLLLSTILGNTFLVFSLSTRMLVTTYSFSPLFKSAADWTYVLSAAAMCLYSMGGDVSASRSMFLTAIASVLGALTLFMMGALALAWGDLQGTPLVYWGGLAMVLIMFVLALLHTRGSFAQTVLSFPQSIAMLPVFTVLIPIYSICNMHDTSWGTQLASTGTEDLRPRFRVYRTGALCV